VKLASKEYWLFPFRRDNSREDRENTNDWLKQPAKAVGPARKARLLDRILIAWKSITEARRVVAVVLPLLKRTKDVTIVEMRATKSKASRDGSSMSSFGLQLLAGPRKHRSRSKSSSTWRRSKEARIRQGLPV
jgi:hypothetical protein